MSEKKSVESIIKEEFINIVNSSKEDSSFHYAFKNVIVVVSKRDGYVSVNGSEIKHVDDVDYSVWLDELASKAFRECVQVFIDKAADGDHSWLHWGLFYSAWASTISNDITVNNIRVAKDVDRVIEVIEFLNDDSELHRINIPRPSEKESEKSYEEKFGEIIGHYGFSNVPFVEERNVFTDRRDDRDILTIDGTIYTRIFLIECAKYRKLPFKLTKEMKRQIDDKNCHAKTREDAISHVNLTHSSEELSSHRGLFGKCVVPSRHK